ncbi:Cro/C1-type helix-turn-helix domain protein [Vibrio phage 1.054.O._10N.261.52.A1]|nr:Cro/C1-type helix-turn-helix domain protein [Vibrio phage 1.054.O._10N.261.52.A1]
MDIGKSINVGCALFNCNKNELAKSIGKSVVTVSQYSNGHTNPSIATLKLIADFFNVPVSTFISWGEE